MLRHGRQIHRGLKQSQHLSGIITSVEVFVVRGVIYDLQLIIEDDVSNDGVFSITADDSITASIKALDIKGNQWLVDGEWSYFHPDFADQSVLSKATSRKKSLSAQLWHQTHPIQYPSIIRKAKW